MALRSTPFAGVIHWVWLINLSSLDFAGLRPSFSIPFFSSYSHLLLPAPCLFAPLPPQFAPLLCRPFLPAFPGFLGFLSIQVSPPVWLSWWALRKYWSVALIPDWVCMVVCHVNGLGASSFFRLVRCSDWFPCCFPAVDVMVYVSSFVRNHLCKRYE